MTICANIIAEIEAIPAADLERLSRLPAVA
jgi:hypothetical protein